MHRFVGIIGIIVILGICYLMSNNKKAISLKTVLSGLALQFALAVFILTVPLGQKIINAVAKCIEKILHFANSGGDFVFGFLKSGAEALSNIASAFYIDQYSGHKKNFSLFSKIITGEDKTFAQYRQTVPNLIKTDLNLDNILLQKLIL